MTNSDLFSRQAEQVGPGSLTLSSREIVKKVPATSHLQRITAELHSRAEFEKAVTAIGEVTSVEPATIRGDLDYFLVQVAAQALSRGSMEVADELAKKFTGQVLGSEISWRGIVMIDGITVDGPCELATGVLLRQPSIDDFNEQLAPYSFSLQDRAGIPSSVIEVTTSARNRPGVGAFVTLLNLSRVCSVEVLLERWRSDSLLPGRDSESMPHRFLMSPSFTCHLGTFDIARVEEFAQNIRDKIPPNPLGKHPQGGWRTAMRYYFHAAWTASSEEERLTQAVNSLESCLELPSRNEIKRTLSQRTASLLRFCGLDEEQVLLRTQKAYDFRSKYAHGGRFSQEASREVGSLSRPIMDYARLCLVKAIEIDNEAQWKKVLRLADLALLVEKSYRELDGLVSGGLWESAPPEDVHSLS